MHTDNSSFHVHIVDDQRSNIDLVSSFLEEEGYRLSFSMNGEDALRAAFKERFDLILLDIGLPDMDGFEVCKHLKLDRATKEIPVIFLSGANDIDSITRAFELGAVDYVSKPFNGMELCARVNTHIQIRKYILEIRANQQRLAQLAATDQTTKIPNEIRFYSELKQHAAAANKGRKNLSLIYLSIDKLGKINEIYGYEGTDRLLLHFAQFVKTLLREEYIFARLHGPEFVVLMPGHSKAAAFALANRIKEKVQEAKLVATRVTCSAGIVEYFPDEVTKAFVKRAEALMHQGRDDGGNMVVG